MHANTGYCEYAIGTVRDICHGQTRGGTRIVMERIMGLIHRRMALRSRAGCFVAERRNKDKPFKFVHYTVYLQCIRYVPGNFILLRLLLLAGSSGGYTVRLCKFGQSDLPRFLGTKFSSPIPGHKNDNGPSISEELTDTATIYRYR